MPTPCVLLGGDGGCTSLQWPHNWVRAGVGGGGSISQSPSPAGHGPQSPGPGAIFAHTCPRQGLKRMSIYLPMKRTWQMLLPGWESLVEGGGLEAPRMGSYQGQGDELAGVPPRTPPRQAGPATRVLGRGLQAIWRPHLQTCLAWVSRPLALEGHTKMVFMLRA